MQVHGRVHEDGGDSEETAVFTYLNAFLKSQLTERFSTIVGYSGDDSFVHGIHPQGLWSDVSDPPIHLFTFTSNASTAIEIDCSQGKSWDDMTLFVAGAGLDGLRAYQLSELYSKIQ